MKKMKQTFCLARATLLLLVMLCSIGAWADGSWSSGDCTVTLTGSTLTVSKNSGDGNGAMANYVAGVVPITPWSNEDISNVVINSGVTHIGNHAFFGLINLSSVTIPASVASIGESAFNGCTNLTSITLNGAVTIGDDAFPTNANTTVTIADGLYLHNGDEVLSGDVTDMDKLNGKTLQPAIPYIKNGTTAYCTNFTVLDNTMTTLAGGWYVVNSDVTFSGNLSINDSGKVHIILCDGATLRANNITPIGNSDRLCIYGQSQGTGTANISGDIMGNYSVSIYGGTINVTGNIICAQGSIGIYGGTITAGQLQALNNGAQITLGGATVKANSYYAGDGVTILPGIIYYDGEGHGYNAGDLSADEIAAIAGKTLTPAIPYIDANGDTAYCTDFTELTSGGAQTLPGGWYVVNSDISRSGMQLFQGDTHIILADDATMTITQDGNNLGLYSEGSLTIYGQTAGSGALNATSLRAIVADDNVTINGGNITANGTDMGIGAGDNIIINGGNVSATGYPYGIEASGNITLGWTKATDQIYASSYSGTVSIASGKTLYNGTEGLSGTINSDDFASKLNGKTLRTYDYRTVSYVKADGTTGSADAIPLTGGGATMLAGGWYVVNSDIEYTGKITLDGDVNLILMANKEMTVSANSVASAIEGNSTGSLTVYGEGSLSVTATNAQAAIGGITAYTQVSGSVTLNAPIYGIYSVGSVAICGGSMTATTTGSANNRIGISSDDNITITGGTVSATGIDGMNASNDVCITGGQVTSNGRINANNGDITLGWTSATDFITASSFSGTVTIAAGQAFINDASTPEIVSGTDIDKALVDGKTLKPQWTGSGDSESDPYMINRPGELDLLATNVNAGTNYSGKYFKLGADIAYSHTTDWDDATSTENNYTAIGGFFNSNGCPFMGTFDGQGHTVSGIRIYRDGNDDVDENLGLFGLVQSGTVKNVTVSDMRITGYALVGGIVGYALVGGIVGYNDIYSSVENCHATATVALNAVQNGAYYFGGIVGYNSNIIGCSSSVTITTSGTLTDCKDFGGIVGSTDDGCSVKNCLAVGVAIPNISFTHYQNDITASGAIAGCFSGDALSHNYYSGCTLGGTLTESGIGAGRDDNGNSNSNERHDVTDNNGAVPTTLHTLTLGEHITASGVLISQGGTISVAEGSTVVLSYSGSLDANKIAVFSLGSTALSGNSFTMPAADATVSVSTVTAWGIDGGADGSEGNPYVITRCAELDLLSQRVNSGTGDDYAASGYSSKTFVLANDIAYAPNGIDANGENYTAIGIYSHSFKGIFDGQGHTISGIRIYKGGQTPNVDGNLGLFGYVYYGTVRNVTLADASITGYDNVGGIAGNSNSGTIENCLVIGTSIRATYNTNGSGGAIVGNNFSGTTLSHNYYSDCIRNISSSGIGTKNGDHSINDGAVRAIILSETEAVPTTLSGKVVFRRSFTKDVASTVCLPFGIDATQAAAAGKFYTFVGVDKSGEKWEVIMQEADTSVDPPVTGNEATTLDANTPYLFKPAATGPVLFYGTAPASVSAGETSDTEGWTFRGTYEKRQWDDTHNQDEIGRIYGFAAQAATSTAESGSHDIEAGQFIRIAGGPNSYALPFRAYLKYEPAPQSAARRTASELPTTMTVRLIGANGETTEITTLNVEHGTLNDDSWYSLDGRKLNAKPTQKGMYIYKGKKQVIK